MLIMLLRLCTYNTISGKVVSTKDIYLGTIIGTTIGISTYNYSNYMTTIEQVLLLMYIRTHVKHRKSALLLYEMFTR